MRWKTRARLAAVAFLTGAFLGANPALIGAGQSQLPQSAIAAQQDFGAFYAHVLNGVEDPAVLVAEVGWVTPLARLGETQFLGRSWEGDMYEVHVGAVLDWGFTGPDGRLYGNLRARAMLSDLPPGEARALSATLSETPLPLSTHNLDFLLAGTRGSL